MATLPELRPNGDVSTTSGILWTNQGGDTLMWQAIDDDPDSPDAADYADSSAAVYVGSAILDLTSTPVDFGNMDTVSIAGFFMKTGARADDDVVFHVKITNAAQDTDYVVEAQIAASDSGGDDTGLQTAGTVTAAGIAASKADWDGARLHIRVASVKAKSWDSGSFGFQAIELRGTYTITSADVNIPVPLGTLALTGYVPTVVASDHQTIPVPLGTLALTGYVPTVVASDDKTVDVPLGTLTLTGYVPTVTVTENVKVDVPLGTLVLTGYVPTVEVTEDIVIEVPLGTLVLTGYVPTVATGADINIDVPLGTLILTGYVPTVTVTENIKVDVPLGTLVLTGYVPTVEVTDNQAVEVPLGTLVLTGYVPTVDIGGPVNIDVPLGILALTGYSPEVTTTGVPDVIRKGTPRRKHDPGRWEEEEIPQSKPSLATRHAQQAKRTQEERVRLKSEAKEKDLSELAYRTEVADMMLKQDQDRTRQREVQAKRMINLNKATAAKAVKQKAKDTVNKARSKNLKKARAAKKRKAKKK